jgi:hypothetical protein
MGHEFALSRVISDPQVALPKARGIAWAIGEERRGNEIKVSKTQPDEDDFR